MSKIGRPYKYKTDEERKSSRRLSDKKYRDKNPNYQKEYYEANKEIVKTRVAKSIAKKSNYYKSYRKKYNKENKSVLAPKNKKKRDSRLFTAIAEWKRGNPELFWEQRLPFIKSKAKQKNIPFNLTVENMTTLTYRQRFCCYYTNFLLISYPGSKGKTVEERMHNLSIDRIDPLKGYVIDNVVLISDFVNSMKLNTNNREFLTLINFIINKFVGKEIKQNKIHTLFKSNRQKFDKFRKLISSKKYINKLNKDIYLVRRQKRKYYPDIKSFKEIDDVI